MMRRQQSNSTPLYLWAAEYNSTTNNSNNKKPMTSSNKELALYINQLQIDVPSNKYSNLPTHLVDPKVLIQNLPYINHVDELSDELLSRCFLPIAYEEGYPTIDGLPIWEKLDGEQLDYYNIFKQYRDMLYYHINNNINNNNINNNNINNNTQEDNDSGRVIDRGCAATNSNTNNSCRVIDRGTVASPTINTTGTQAMTPLIDQEPAKMQHKVINTRSLAKLGDLLDLPVPLLKTLSQIFHWGARCKAFDQYKEDELAFRRECEQHALERVHASTSKKLVDHALNYLMDDKNLKKLDPKVALQMVELGMKYGRLSVGLQGDKPGCGTSDKVTLSSNTNLFVNAHPSVSSDGGTPNVELHVENNVQVNRAGNKSAEKDNETDVMTSILHVLNSSGAFEKDKKTKIIETLDEDGNVVSQQDMMDAIEVKSSPLEGEIIK